ncbi:MAG: hypothetical protein JXK05_12125 [Campylobacterales bacterium]|nr:hypothetical protein [Campylobacterales bacterium]
MQVAIDTLDIYSKLKSVNLDDNAAKMLSEIFKQHAQAIIEQQREELATKKDIAEAKIDLIKWVAGMLVAQAAIVATLVKLL